MAKRFIENSIHLLCLGCAMILIASCSNDDDELSYLSASFDSSKVPASGGTVIVDIKSNCVWSIGNLPTMTIDGIGNYYAGNYVSFSQTTGTGNSQLIVSIAPTTQTSEVLYSIEINYDNGSKQERILIRQSASSSSGGSSSGGSSSGGNSGNDSYTPTKPSSPTGVYVENYGSVTVPDVTISWSSVAGATKYYIYRSTSANGSYSQIGTTTYTYYSDSNVKIGNTYYYKIKAYNSAGLSDYSEYAKFEFKDTRKPGPVTYGNCTVSGTTMTLKWSIPSHNSYGKPTKALLRVKNPYSSSEYATVQELSGTATSVSFQYLPWVDSNGYVYVGIILENDYGTGGGTPKIYDNNAKKWIN